MKRLFIIIFPMVLLISIVFTIMNKEFNFISFLNFISNLRFNNAYNTFKEINVEWGNFTSSIKDISFTINPLKIVEHILDCVISIFRIAYLSCTTIFDIIHDLFVNMVDIFEYLFL